ncbi:MAG: mechanosensitive ion channel [Bacteroidales bacterium]|nr:mechanosensitive ion channel [Bacteroidales bacterium]MDD4575679.1 mechanosensitive ion channel [Bacteroidales bacterium]
MLATIIFTALSILFIFRLLNYMSRILPYSKNIRHHVGYILPVIELISWIGFMLWYFRYIFNPHNYTGLIIFGVVSALLIISMFFLLKDFLFGVFLKMQRKIDEGNIIELDSIKGVIIKAGHFSIDVKTKQGDIKTIPYNKFRSKIISKPGGNINLYKQSIVLKFPDTIDVTNIVPDLKKTLFNAPWVAPSEQPIINKIQKIKDGYKMEIVVYALKEEHTEKIRKYIMENLS